jgi:hypothetical protein
MSTDAEPKLFAVCPTKRETFDVSEVYASANDALVLWARDESVEGAGDVRALLSRGHINVHVVRRLARCDSHVNKAAENAVGGFLDSWQEVYGADAEHEPACAPAAYRECTAAIEDALRQLADGLLIKRYESTACEALAVDQVVAVLRAKGVFG